MLRMFTNWLICLCLAALVAVQIGAPGAVAAEPPCHATKASVCPADPSAPCPAPDAACRETLCLGHAVAVAIPTQHFPTAHDVATSVQGEDAPPLHPRVSAGGPLRPPNA
ncbi:hypothetical protein [Defluviimonas sp. SAOS-178_SWC]|uniref:hypothetical protein n=1 Tax=Defluviimonas sp. SAOS-178_SWC TaxID=3121287 RepID=UPI003221CF3D